MVIACTPSPMGDRNTAEWSRVGMDSAPPLRVLRLRDPGGLLRVSNEPDGAGAEIGLGRAGCERAGVHRAGPGL